MLFVLTLAVSAAAHLQSLRGHLIDLVQRSELIAIGSVEQLQPVGMRHSDVTVAIEQVLAGTPPAPQQTFRGPTGMAVGERYVVFLRRAGSGFESVAPSGTIFPARREDDGDYRGAVTGINAALHAGPPGRVAAVRAALIPALSASAAPLRYHAALELSAIARDHALTDGERRQLAQVLANPATDPALAPILSALLQRTPNAAAP